MKYSKFVLDNFPKSIQYIENKKKRYDELANSYIRERYTESQEFAILRQRDTKKKEFQEYFDYCEECKARARQEIIDNTQTT